MGKKMKRKKDAKEGRWIDAILAEYILPDSIEAIERGRVVQGKLFPERSANRIESLRKKIRGEV